MKPVLIISAVIQEVSHLIESLACEHSPAPGCHELYVGKSGERQVVVAASGIGKVNAASAVSALIIQWDPELIISTGCAGAFPEGGLVVGDLALAVSELFGDEGVLTPEGWRGMEFIGIPVLDLKGEQYYNEIPLSFSASEKAVQLAAALDIPLRRGRFLTVSTCSGTAVRGDEMYDRFAPVCENMEGAAIALVSLQHGIDCIEVRGISNMVEDRDVSSWNIPLAVGQAQRFVLKLVEEL